MRDKETKDNRIIPGPLPSDFIIVATDSIGKKLLSSMGWKQGHGGEI